MATDTISNTSPIVAINYGDGKHLRSRRLVTRSRARPTGKYPSWKVGRMVEWESVHERNAYCLLDAIPAVLAFQEQPCEIRFWLEGTEHRHFPDILISLTTRKELWEVKTEADAARDHVRARTELLSEHLPSFGYRYRVVLAKDLGAEPRLGNIKLLNRLGRRPIPALEAEHLRRLMERGYTFVWGELSKGMLGPHGLCYVCRLVLEGKLFINHSRPLSSETVFSPEPLRDPLLE